jgi:hypothetical protein
MYPVGFLTLAAFLRRHGYRVAIVNLALLMMRSRRFRPERLLRRLRPRLFGIDLHWLPHAHGSLAVAALLRELHPDIPIVFGGISSTYFHQELIADPAVDFVLRGSVTEPCLLALLREVAGERRFERVPNLTWKDAAGVHVNRATFTPRSLDDYPLDLGMMVSSVLGRLDFWTSVPFHSWWRHPITAVFTARGCRRALRHLRRLAGRVRRLHARLPPAAARRRGDRGDGGRARRHHAGADLPRRRPARRRRGLRPLGARRARPQAGIQPHHLRVLRPAGDGAAATHRRGDPPLGGRAVAGEPRRGRPRAARQGAIRQRRDGARDRGDAGACAASSSTSST